MISVRRSSNFTIWKSGQILDDANPVLVDGRHKDIAGRVRHDEGRTRFGGCYLAANGVGKKGICVVGGHNCRFMNIWEANHVVATGQTPVDHTRK